VQVTRELIGQRMFPLTLAGLDGAIRELRRISVRSAAHVARHNDDPSQRVPQ
jgi:hypothetical protein